MSAYAITKFSKQHLDQVKKLLPPMWYLHADKTTIMSRKYLEEYDLDEHLRDFIDKKDRFAIVALDGETVIGFLNCIIKNLPEHYILKQELYLDDLVVADEYRNQGVASAMIQFAEQEGKKLNLKRVSAKVWNFNQAPQHVFNQKNGYQADYTIYSKEI